jgi:hypothetical protein
VFNLSAKDVWHATCKIGAISYDAEVRVNFLKSFSRRRICDKIFQKELTNKKVGALPKFPFATKHLAGEQCT